jgi:hypothetical protein
MSTALVVAAPDNKRTTVTIPYPQDPFAIVDGWAGQNGYRVVGGGGNERMYQKGYGFWVAPMMLGVKSEAGVVTLQAWVRGTFIARLFSFFIVPAEMHVRSGGFVAVLPRRIARGGVNQLIAQLGGQQIQ